MFEDFEKHGLGLKNLPVDSKKYVLRINILSQNERVKLNCLDLP